MNPPRKVWERSELNPVELTLWSFLVAATGKAMLDALPRLEGGCINYWEAGNWALNHEAEPKGPKTAPEYRRVHAHLLGRSRMSLNPAWKWGEAPKFPDFEDRHSWASKNERLTPEECRAIIGLVQQMLISTYGFEQAQISDVLICSRCGYPAPVQNVGGGYCPECQSVPPRDPRC